MAVASSDALKRLLSAQFAARGLTVPQKYQVETPASEPTQVNGEAKPETETPSKPVAAGIDFGALMRAIPTQPAKVEPQPEAPSIDPAPVIHDEIPGDDRGIEWSDEYAVDPNDFVEQEYVDVADPFEDMRPTRQAMDILAGVNFALDPSQEEACFGLAQEQYGCLIGAAGTGKTTTVRFLLHTLLNGSAERGIEPLRVPRIDIRKYVKNDDIEVESHVEDHADIIPAIALVAFTGQAVQVLKKNMPESWRRNCMTIHSLLGYAPEEYTKEDGKKGWRFSPTYGRHLKFPWNVIIVDESSMVNVHLWHEMLDACNPGTRIYFIGDLNQLPPPIGQGVLGFALAKWPVFELTVVHRQKEAAANRIVDSAWDILQGKEPSYDDPKANPNWRVISMDLAHDADKAHRQIVAIAKGLSQQRVHESVDSNRPVIYDPWRDRILTPINGYSEESTGAMVGQFPLNQSLSQIFAEDGEPRMVIDFKKGTKKFGVGYRVMATKNESPSEKDRVTNGLTGKIIGIEPNPDWTGDWRLVGDENKVAARRQEMVVEALSHSKDSSEDQIAAMKAQADAAFADIDFGEMANMTTQPEEKQSGPASHIVTVYFDNGATRVYNLNAEIEQLQIAYASTTHKAQGAEMPTVIIVVHHAAKRMLTRENLYTAITRASQRVVILKTDFGMRIALSTQKIYGKNLSEKVRQYIRLMTEVEGTGLAPMLIRLSVEG